MSRVRGPGLLVGLIGLIGLTALIGPGGCGQSPMAIRYKAERDLWRSRGAERRLALRPGTDRVQMDEAARGYESILKRYPLSSAGSQPEEVQALGRVRVTAAASLTRLYVRLGERQNAISTLWNMRGETSSADLDAALRLHSDLLELLSAATGPDSLIEIYRDLAARFPPGTPDGQPLPMVLESPLRLADLFRRLGRTSEMSETLDRALEYYRQVSGQWAGKPLEIAALVQQANALVRQERMEEAEAILQSTRKLPQADPYDASILLSLGVLQEQAMHAPVQAQETYRELVRLYPNDTAAPQAEFRLGLTYAATGRPDSALAIFDRTEKAYGRDLELAARVRLQEARVLNQAGRVDQALSRYRSVVVDFPRTEASLQAPFEIAEYYRSRKDVNGERATLREATAEYERLVQDLAGDARRGPVVVLALDQLAAAWVRLEEWQKAVEVLDKRAEAFPTDGRSPLALVQAAAILESRLGDHKATIAMLQKVVSRYPGIPLAGRAKDRIAELEAKWGSSER
jgi:tetratricopeptide (TPR) repeat protein